MISIRRKLMAKMQSGGGQLPDEYQEVEYLESSGGQYIVTDIPQKSGFRAKYEIEIISHINDTQQIFAALNVNGNAIYYPYASSGKWYYGYGVAKNTGVSVVAHNRYTIDAVLAVGEQTVKVDDVIIASGTNTLNINLAHTMHLFASNNVQNPRYAYARIYNFTVENSQANRLVANYIPCRRKSDSKPGMYDLVTRNFYVNQGTGEFLYGADVN